MHISPTRNVTFRATLRGDVDKIKKLAIAGGASKDTVELATNYIHQLLPDSKDKVYLYFKKYANENKKQESIVRSGIKIVKDGVVYEKNIDPTKILQKNLLYKFVSEVKKILYGISAPDESLKMYSVPQEGWLERFNDKDIKMLAFTPMF